MHISRRFRRPAVAAAALVLTVGLGACGDDDSDDNGATADTEPEPAEVGEAGDDDITIEGSTFKVQGPVKKDDDVTVTNKDGFTHTVTMDADGFDVSVDGGATETFAADQEPGSYAFHCKIHPSMKGTLVIE